MAKLKSECPSCGTEVSIKQGDMYACECGWRGSPPTAVEPRKGGVPVPNRGPHVQPGSAAIKRS